MKKVSVIVLVILIVLLLLPGFAGTSFAFEKTMDLSVSSASGHPGETVTVIVALSRNTGFASLKFGVSYDQTKLTLAEVSFSDQVGSYAVAPTPYQTPQTISIISPMSDNTMNGRLASLVFHISENASRGFTPITISYDQDNTFDSNFNDIQLSVSDGGIDIEKNNSGDELPFSDVNPSDYYYSAVCWAVQNGITSGTSETTFSPNAGCTRAQVVTFLWRAAGSLEPESTSNPFTDVKSDRYYYKAVLWAAENGITTGTSAATFSPNATCTRAQVVTFLWRYEKSPSPITANNPFSDVKPTQYYYEAVLWAAETNVTAGTSATTFSPNATCTRAQVVTFLYRDLVKPE